MFEHFEEKFIYYNELNKKILIFLLATILVSPSIGFAKTESTNNENKHETNVTSGEITPEHLVESIVLFDEIYDIDISEGHYRVSAELMMTWEADTNQFLSEFGDKIIHGEKLELFLNLVRLCFLINLLISIKKYSALFLTSAFAIRGGVLFVSLKIPPARHGI